MKTHKKILRFSENEIDKLISESTELLTEIRNKTENENRLIDRLRLNIHELIRVYENFPELINQEKLYRLNTISEYLNSRNIKSYGQINIMLNLLEKCKENTENIAPNYFSKESHNNSCHTGYSLKKHQWITFKRNNSWFITEYREYEYVENTDSKKFPESENTMKLNNMTCKFWDPISSSTKIKITPDFFLILNQDMAIPVDKKGKRIASDRVSIFNIEPLQTSSENIITGKTRIMGKSYLYIDFGK